LQATAVLDKPVAASLLATPKLAKAGADLWPVELVGRAVLCPPRVQEIGAHSPRRASCMTRYLPTAYMARLFLVFRKSLDTLVRHT